MLICTLRAIHRAWLRAYGCKFQHTQRRSTAGVHIVRSPIVAAGMGARRACAWRLASARSPTAVTGRRRAMMSPGGGFWFRLRWLATLSTHKSCAATAFEMGCGWEASGHRCPGGGPSGVGHRQSTTERPVGRPPNYRGIRPQA